VKLSTIECVWVGCGREVSGDLAMYHLIDQAQDVGWTFFDGEDETRGLCPEHSDADVPVHKWLVGCHTCSFEEEYASEEEAKDEAQYHECEADTYIHSPAQQVEREESTRRWRTQRAEEEKQVRIAAELATARQQLIEKRANNWLRLRNTLVFWNKEKP
jgi:hypothetical protein